jgi:hypothetical protein
MIESSHAQKNSGVSVADARKELVGKTVVVTTPSAELQDSRGLSQWYQASAASASGVNLSEHLPATYQNKRAVVVAVEPVSARAERNALGESIDDGSLKGVSCYLIVRFGDGVLGATMTLPSLMLTPHGQSRAFRLLGDDDKRKALIAANLPHVVGETVYAVAYSKLFRVTATTDDLINQRPGQRTLRFPRLAPLTIEAAKFDEETDLIILKLKTNEGEAYLASSRFETLPQGPNTFRDELFRDASLIAPGLLKDLSPRETAAIKKGTLFVGMSDVALAWTIGLPDHENNWGLGGKQYVYAGGSLLVYLDAHDRVVNWQRFER